MAPSPIYDPIELLTNKGERKPRFLTAIYNPIACAAAGFGLAMTLNWAFRRPVFSGKLLKWRNINILEKPCIFIINFALFHYLFYKGLQKHIGFAGVGLLLGQYIEQKRSESLATRDAILRHYVELHRDDFPNERKLILAL